jgi:HlyD family secretion protein
VLCVPSKALRFTPVKETVGDKKIEDCQGKNKVWVLEGNTLKARQVQIGMSDGAHTEIINGISKGVEVITEVKITEGEIEEEGNERSPFAPGPPNKNRKK